MTNMFAVVYPVISCNMFSSHTPTSILFDWWSACIHLRIMCCEDATWEALVCEVVCVATRMSTPVLTFERDPLQACSNLRMPFSSMSSLFVF